MIDDGLKSTRQGISDWEKELWSYISGSDGRTCPLSDSCQLAGTFHICSQNETARETLKRVHSFVDSDEINPGDNNISHVIFQGCLRQGKIFKGTIKLANKFLNKRWNGSLPVPDNLISRGYDNLPIEVRYLPLKTNHGAVWRLNDCWMIHLNSNNTPAKQRFTLYHEIFHILAHCQCQVTPVFRKKNTDELNFNEILADHFAANILLPQKQVRELWTETKDINRMAEIFNAPKPIVYISLRADGLI